VELEAPSSDGDLLQVAPQTLKVDHGVRTPDWPGEPVKAGHWTSLAPLAAAAAVFTILAGLTLLTSGIFHSAISPSTIPTTLQPPPPSPSPAAFTVYVSCRDTAGGPVATVRAIYPATYAGKPVYFRFNGSPPRQPISSLAQKGTFQKQFDVSNYLHQNGKLDVILTGSQSGNIDLGYGRTYCP
jgi:hypothetical protein